MPGTLFVVATPIGNLEDVSARALRVLREATLIAAEDTRRTSKLLARYAIETPVTSLHEHNERSKAPSLISRLISGDSIALVSDAGTPTVSDPGGVLISAAIAAGVRVEPVPGPSALIALLSVSGLPTDSFVFLGFPPIKSNDRSSWLSELGGLGRTAIFYESPHRIIATLESIRTNYGECHIVVGRELTKAHEEVIRGPISGALAAIGEPVGEFCVALNLEQPSRSSVAEPPSDQSIADEFGLTTEKLGLTRRKTITAVARKLGLPPNVVYAALERTKGSGN